MVYEAIIHYGLKHQAEHTCFATSHCQNQAVKCETYQVYLLLLGRGRLFRGFLRRFFFSRPSSEVFQYHSEPSLLKYPFDYFSLKLHEATTQNQLVEIVASELLVIREFKSGFRHPS